MSQYNYNTRQHYTCQWNNIFFVHYFRWEESRFQIYQVLKSIAASDACFYHSANLKFLFFPDHIKSKLLVFEWKNNNFTEIQSVQTPSRTQTCTSFFINNELYVATGGWAPSNATTIYKWSGTQFLEFQILDTSYVSRLSHIVVGHHVFLAAASMISADSSFAAHSNVYRLNGSRFTLFDAVTTQASRSARFFVVLGNIFLAVANQGRRIGGGKASSSIYKVTQDRLVPHQEIRTSAASDIWPFVYNGQQFLFVANTHDGDAFTTNSTVYRWQE